ncbi:MAG: hypothetical protein E7383_09730 [Ruminococcaceae bacterium]|nr:hypothetical protein [Oscillospiraceae bacterium]
MKTSRKNSDNEITFSDFIRDKIDFYNENNGKNWSIYDLGDRLGITHEMIRKKLNKSKYIKERDCVIAMCIVLQLSPGEIDEALYLYDMQPLNPKDDRDKLIEGLASDSFLNKTYSLSIERLNAHLHSMGFSELTIQKNKDKFNVGKTKGKRKILPYKIIEDVYVVSPEEDDMYYENRYNSLSTEYDPSEIVTRGYMLLLDSQDNKILLSADTKGELSTETLGKDVFSKKYESIEDTGAYFVGLYMLRDRNGPDFFARMVLPRYTHLVNQRNISKGGQNGLYKVEINTFFG